MLLKAVKERDFDSLPDFISDAAEKCLEVITKTENGQLCDIAADRACLEAMSGFAKVPIMILLPHTATYL